MKTVIGKYGIYLGGVIVMILIVVTVYWVLAKGAGTPGSGKPGDFPGSGGASEFSPNRVRKIIIRGNGDSGDCIEITPDGAVRTYETCGGEMTDAFRTNDSRAVHRLFVAVSETKLSKTYVAGSFRVEVETDDGTYIYYVLPGDGENDDSPGIDGLIDTIINDQPKPTPTAEVIEVLITPTVFLIPSGTRAPQPTGFSFEPTPTSGPGKGFTCDYDDRVTAKRPYRISNYVCSTEPVPNP